MIYNDVMTFVRDNFALKQKTRIIYDKHKRYLRIGAGFDIETTRKDNHAYMYLWQVSYGEHELYGRTWYAFDSFMQHLQAYLKRINARLIMWVANLGHEFAFLGRRYHWTKVFARESHQPLVAETGFVEFRECLRISGQGGLANLAKHYTKTQKAVGDLDYTKMRNSSTPISETEMGYAINDVRILSEWGEYIFSEYSDQKRSIPLTSIGIVRDMIKQAAADTGALPEIKRIINGMFPQRQTYNFIMKYLFRGGYTHANSWWAYVRADNVIGADFTSSYPSVMLHDYYPKSEFIPCELQVKNAHITSDLLQTHCVWFVAVIRNIRKKTAHTIESEHKLIGYEHGIFDNGRLASADTIRVALTEVDYAIYEMFYEWDNIKIDYAYKAVRGKLPEYILRPLRNAYTTKARIKKACKADGSNPDDLPEYRNAKATINSYYGVMVQRLNFTDWKYDEVSGEWSSVETDKTYSKMVQNIILNPFWGIYVTAHARYNLLSVIAEIDGSTLDFACVYCDTDSVYGIDCKRFRDVVASYNVRQEIKNKKLPPEFADIGCFDWIGGIQSDGEPQHYEFKTLGAKRYLKYHDGVAEVTVAGMRKGTYEKAIVRQFATDNCYVLYDNPKKKQGKIGYVDVNELFDTFTDGFCLSCDQSEKNGTVYEPHDYSDVIIDDYGNSEEMHEKCGVAIVPITFSISMDTIYANLIKQVLEERRIPIWK